MSSLRSFASCREAMQAHRPAPKTKVSKKAKVREFSQHAPTHYAATEAWAWEDLGEWPKKPPVDSIHLLPEFGGMEALDDPQAFIDSANFGNAVGTWNARDEDGAWACDPGRWIIVRAGLGRSDGDSDFEEDCVHVTFACWRVEEGFAVAIVKSGLAREWLPQIMGLEAWPEGWQTASIWYGE